MADRKHFTGITAEAFVSDGDKWALDKLQKIPLLPQVIQKFYEMGVDRWLYLWNMSMSVQCGPNQYPTLYNILHESCRVLDMPEPQLYVSSNPFPNAWTGGVERPYITLWSGVVDTLTDEQLYHLMGHELGHIKADHVLYMTVANTVMPLLDYLGRRTLGLGDAATIGLLIALYEWYRQAEISADRAGLLVSQSFELSVDANVMLTSGPTRLRHEMNREAFLEQARAYQDAGPWDQVGKALIFLLVGHRFTHPMPVHRVKELERWVLAGEFDRIMAGDYAGAPVAA